MPWHGLQFMDTVFPLFLFIAGVSFPFSAAKSRANGLGDGRIALRCLKRGALLVLLGLVYGGLLKCDFAHQRVWSVLGRIGIAWTASAWLYLRFRARTRIGIAALLLIVTTCLFRFVLAPDAPIGADPFSPEGNLGCWLDRTLTTDHTHRPLFDPEGFAGILPAIVTAMLGVFAGELVRGNGGASGRKALSLLGCGVFCALAGFAWSFVFPINKALWSPSFTLVVGGYSFAMFALFYWVIDVKRCAQWSFCFRIIGMNAITIYLAQRIVPFNSINSFFLGGIASLLPATVVPVLMRIGYITLCWLFLLFLYRKNVFLKV